MVKEILIKVIGGDLLNYEKLIIILYGCKQVINSRPITNFSDDSRTSIPLNRMMFFQEMLLSAYLKLMF